MNQLNLSAVDYKELAARYMEGSLDDDFRFDMYYNAYYQYDDVDVVAKERPRTGKGGRVYTPKETRQFEAKVKKWATQLNMPRLLFPIRVVVAVYDRCPSDLIGFESLVFYQKNDVDNVGKAVLDGLNKVAYKDDKQICNLTVRRRYNPVPGFSLYIERAGLSAGELDNLKKYIKVLQDGKKA